MPPIHLFRALDSPISSTSSLASYEAKCNLVNAEAIMDGIAHGRGRQRGRNQQEIEWYNGDGDGSWFYVESEMAAGGKSTVERSAVRDKVAARVGLNTSASLVLDIIGISQRAGKYGTQCREIADSAFQLVNAIDAGVHYRVVDVSNVLKDHIERLNHDLEEIVDALKPYAAQSWWKRLRSRSKTRKDPNSTGNRAQTSHASHHGHSDTSLPGSSSSSDPFKRCLSILRTRTELYSLLISCCLAQADRQVELRAKYTELTGGPLRRPVTMNSNDKGKERAHRRAFSEGAGNVERSKLRLGIKEKEKGKDRVVKIRVIEEKTKKTRIEFEEPTNTSEDKFNRYRARSLSESDDAMITIRPPTPPPKAYSSTVKLKKQTRGSNEGSKSTTMLGHYPTHARVDGTMKTSKPNHSNPNLIPKSHYRTPYTAKPITFAPPQQYVPNPSLPYTAGKPAMTSAQAPQAGIRFLRNRSQSASAVPSAYSHPRLAPQSGGQYGGGYAGVWHGRT